MGFKDIQSAADVPAWEAELNGNRPSRQDVTAHIVTKVSEWVHRVSAPHVLELCPGPGMLAEALLTALPQITYTGIDFSAPIAEYARMRLAPFSRRAWVVQANLNEDGWLTEAPGPYDAIVSMQSLHDLGDEYSVSRIYGLAKELLSPGGLFLNADLILQPEDPRPGRLFVARHLELLTAHGYQNVACTLEVGDFACFCGSS